MSWTASLRARAAANPRQIVFPESAEDRILVYPDSSRAKGIELYHEGDIGRKLSLRAAYSFASVKESRS